MFLTMLWPSEVVEGLSSPLPPASDASVPSLPLYIIHLPSRYAMLILVFYVVRIYTVQFFFYYDDRPGGPRSQLHFFLLLVNIASREIAALFTVPIRRKIWCTTVLSKPLSSSQSPFLSVPVTAPATLSSAFQSFHSLPILFHSGPPTLSSLIISRCYKGMIL